MGISERVQGSTIIFPNLAVGQPSNNMDLSESDIYLGMMIICLHLYVYFLFQNYCVWSVL